MNNINSIKLKRGDVYIVDFRGLDCGLYGYVPAIIVQSNRVNPNSSTTIVVPVFTLAEESPYCVPLKGEKLRKHSKALCERIVCIDKSRLKNLLCRLDEEEMRKVTKTLKRTGIHPFVGLLNNPGDIDKGNELIIDELPLDYSILEEIDYVYPAHNAYFAYMTRGCVNKCKFCAVPKLEPQYCDYINLRERIETTRSRFGEQKDLLLLDNNVLASNCYNQIIDEIRDCGFGVGATYTPPNEYEIMINNLRDSYNDRAYVKKAIKIFRELMEKIKDDEIKTELFKRLEEAHCLYPYTATKEAILELDEYVRPLYDSTYKPSKRKRIVDFNQGIDSRLITDANMEKLSEVNIYPLRIAFDHWKLKDIYEKSIRTAASKGIKSLSNYLLYNFEDKPEEL